MCCQEALVSAKCLAKTIGYFHIMYSIIFLTITILTYFFYFRYSRRRLYELMNSLPGPKGYPIIGNALQVAVNFQGKFYHRVEFLSLKWIKSADILSGNFFNPRCDLKFKLMMNENATIIAFDVEENIISIKMKLRVL